MVTVSDSKDGCEAKGPCVRHIRGAACLSTAQAQCTAVAAAYFLLPQPRSFPSIYHPLSFILLLNFPSFLFLFLGVCVCLIHFSASF